MRFRRRNADQLNLDRELHKALAELKEITMRLLEKEQEAQQRQRT